MTPATRSPALAARRPRIACAAVLLALVPAVAAAGTARAESAPACNLYASTSGSDANPGTQAAPFATLVKLMRSLKAGQTGCLQSGQTFDTSSNVSFENGETHGEANAPVTVTSTNPASPAVITHSLALGSGANYLVFTHLKFEWSMPKPWVCWSSGGDPIAGKVISGPNSCAAGNQGSENAVQVVLGGKSDTLSYDEITSNDTNICLLLGSSGENEVIENSRIHDCGPTVRSSSEGFPVVNEEWGWHTHGIYAYAHGAVIRNSYIYSNARNGVLLYGGGEGIKVEHNVIDRNGAGVWFGNDSNDVVSHNIITNSSSPRGVADVGIGSNGPGANNSAVENCLYNNAGGEISGSGFTSTNNKTGANPLYVNGEAHEYRMQAGSPCVGYGPASAQPEASKENVPPAEPGSPGQPAEPPHTETPSGGSTGGVGSTETPGTTSGGGGSTSGSGTTSGSGSTSGPPVKTPETETVVPPKVIGSSPQPGGWKEWERHRRHWLAVIAHRRARLEAQRRAATAARRHRAAH